MQASERQHVFWKSVSRMRKIFGYILCALFLDGLRCPRLASRGARLRIFQRFATTVHSQPALTSAALPHTNPPTCRSCVRWKVWQANHGYFSFLVGLITVARAPPFTQRRGVWVKASSFDCSIGSCGFLCRLFTKYWSWFG